MAREVKVTLGGVEYAVTQPSMKHNKEWRSLVEQPFDQIASILTTYQDIEINSAGDLAAVVRLASEVVLGMLDTAIDLLFEYSAELSTDRERIESEANDDEAIAALVEVLKLAYPFGGLLAVVPGRRATTTSQNLPSQNGANGTRKSTAARSKS